mmetsp:Transcript_13785/g.20085  ORF Transcript_13785/g.20085 Transcript_13785/m.20085 type:complete len:237 (+) Transcript_13785:870-1580(+)
MRKAITRILTRRFIQVIQISTLCNTRTHDIKWYFVILYVFRLCMISHVCKAVVGRCNDERTTLKWHCILDKVDNVTKVLIRLLDSFIVHDFAIEYSSCTFVFVPCSIRMNKVHKAVVTRFFFHLINEYISNLVPFGNVVVVTHGEAALEYGKFVFSCKHARSQSISLHQVKDAFFVFTLWVHSANVFIFGVPVLLDCKAGVHGPVRGRGLCLEPLCSCVVSGGALFDHFSQGWQLV